MGRRTLIIMRHAKTEPSHPRGDHARGLTEAGRTHAHTVGKWLAEQNTIPTVVHSSDSARTRQTWNDVRSGLPDDVDVDVRFTRDLYTAGPQDLMEHVWAIDDDADCAVLLGHQPTVGEVINLLTGEVIECPSGTAAILTVEADSWGDVQEGTCELEYVFSPSRVG